jgi:GT2 family glycosyltransferase
LTNHIKIPISVAIATHGRTELLDRTLGSIALAILPAGLSRILIVENGSDAAERVVAKYSNALPIAYHMLSESGKSRALEWALGEIGEGLVVFFDDDVRVDRHVLACYAAAAQTTGRGYFFGGPIRIDYPDGPPPQWLRPRLPRSAVGWEPEDESDPGIARSLFVGFNYAAYAEDIKRVGGFNPYLGPGAMRRGTEGNPTGQEYEMQLRLVAAGVQPRYVKGAVVWHYVPRDRCSPEWALHRVYRDGYTNGMLLGRKTGPSRTRWVVGAMTLLGRLPGAWFRARAARCTRDEERRFALRKPLSHGMGRIRGYCAAYRDCRK